jgi:hypothetical protein
MAHALGDLGEVIHDRTLILNVLRGLNEKFAHMRIHYRHARLFPTFHQVRNNLLLEELTSSKTQSAPSTALVTMAPKGSSPSTATSPPAPSGCSSNTFASSASSCQRPRKGAKGKGGKGGSTLSHRSSSSSFLDRRLGLPGMAPPRINSPWRARSAPCH